MMRDLPARALLPLVMLSLGACAQADPVFEESSTGTGDTSQAASNTEPTAEEVPMGAMGSTGEHDHEHGTDDVREWDGAEVPEISIEVTGDNDSGWVIRTDIAGFTISGPDALEHVPGEGHAHVLIDGELRSMIFEPELRIPELLPGTHEVMVRLGTNDHLEYVVKGEPLMAMTTVVVEGTVAPADLAISVKVDGGVVRVDPERPEAALGAVVELTVESDVSDEVHVHGYDLTRPVAAGQVLTFRFEADVPGVFEVELEGSGTGLFELRVG